MRNPYSFGNPLKSNTDASLFRGGRRMAGIEYAKVRAAISIRQVLELLEFEPSFRQGDQWRGPCPIHGSQSPQSRSFSVSLGHSAFRCFSCGAEGNQLDLWSLAQHLPLYEATLELCERLSIEVPTCATPKGGIVPRARPEKRNP